MINLDQYIGQSIEVEDASNLDQCFDWAFFVCDLLGIPRAAIRTLYAKDIWTKYDPKYFDKVAGAPQYLDLAIWDTRVGPSGHVAAVKTATAGGFQSYDQNWGGILKVRVVDHNSFGLLGFLRPKLKGGSMPNIDPSQLHQLMVGLWGRFENEEEKAAYSAKPLQEVINILLSNKTFSDHLDYIHNLEAQNTSLTKQLTERPEPGEADRKLAALKTIINDILK